MSRHWIDNRSAAAERVYRAISRQELYSEKEALGLLLQEVATKKKADLTADELIEKFHLGTIEDKGDESPKPVSKQLAPRKTSEEAEEEEEEVEDEEGFAGSQLATVARMISIGGTGLDSISSVFEHHAVTSNLESLVEYVLTKSREQWRTLLHGIFPVHHIQTMLLVCVVQLISVPRLLATLPILLCYVSFFVMVYSTLRMFQSKHMIRELEVWQRLLKVFSPKGEEDEGGEGEWEDEEGVPISSQSFYSWQSLEPYVFYFLATLAFVVSFGLCGKNLPNSLLLCGISLFFCLLCFVALTDRFDGLALWALILNFFSHLPVILRQLHLHQWAIFEDIFWFRLGIVKVSVGLTSAAYLLIPGLYILMALGYPRRDVYKIVIPHLVCYLWFETALALFLAGIIKFELTGVLLTLGIISLVVSPTGVGAVLVFGLVVGQIRGSVSFLNCLKALVTLVILFLPFLYRKLMGLIKKYHGSIPEVLPGQQHRKTRMLLLLGFYVCLVLMSVTLLYHGSALGPGVHTRVSNLSWTHFEQNCGEASKAADNQIVHQVLCSELKGMAVEWKGAVSSVRVSKIDNSLETLLDYLPSSLANALRCFYGTTPFKMAGRWGFSPETCSLSSHHVYTLELAVTGPWGEHLISSKKGSVVLTASAVFMEMLGQLREGDVVRFLAYFENYPVFRYPHRLRLLRLSCSSCRYLSSKSSPSVVSDFSLYSGFWSRLFYSFKFVFNFIFAPFLYIPTS